MDCLGFRAEAFAGEPFIGFVDNNGDRFSLIKGWSSFLQSSVILELASSGVERAQVRPWWEWVRSPSNPADAPSRLDLRPRGALEGAPLVLSVADWKAVTDKMRAVFSMGGGGVRSTRGQRNKKEN